MSPLVLIALAVVAIALLIVLIARFKLNAFIVIFAVSLLLAVFSGMAPLDAVKSFETGVGGALGHIAIIVALGTMLGKMLAESGGAERIAVTLVSWFGTRHVHWAMMLIGFIVGLPVFFEVGFVLLIPIAFNVARRTGTPLLLVAMPLIAGLSTVHGLMPPHPAALLALQAYKADIGRTILYALVVGLPTAALAGPVFARIIAPRIALPAVNPMEAQFVAGTGTGAARSLPGFGITLATVLLPVALMLVGSWADLVAPAGSAANQALRFVGNTDMALLLATILSFYTLGIARGFNRETILRFTNECLAPTAVITLLIGAGGGFGRILLDSGVSKAIVGVAVETHVPLLLLAWLLAAIVRLAAGSSTVAMSTAAGIVAPIAASTPGVSPELLVLATGAGSLLFSHVNDGGFWLVKEYLNMSVTQTMKTWSMLETIISVVALLLTAALSVVV